MILCLFLIAFPCCLPVYSCPSCVCISKYLCLCARERADGKSYSQGKMSLEGIFLNSILMCRPSQMCALTHLEWHWVVQAPCVNGHLPREEPWTPLPEPHASGLASGVAWDRRSPQRAATGLQSLHQHTVPPGRMQEACYYLTMYPGDALSSRKCGVSEVKVKPFLRILYCNFLMIGSCIYNSGDYFNEKFCNGR